MRFPLAVREDIRESHKALRRNRFRETSLSSVDWSSSNCFILSNQIYGTEHSGSSIDQKRREMMC